MSHLDPVRVDTPPRSQQEMLKDHNQILQNYFDTYITRGFKPGTIDGACWFIKRWFEKIGCGTRAVNINSTFGKP